MDTVLEREDGLSEKRAQNVAFVEHLDYSVGRVLDSLKENGLAENTLVVFSSDNGGALRYAQSNGKLRGGKKDMYEGGIKVPTFAVWKDKIKPGSSNDSLSLLMDLFPTFCEVAGAKVPDGIDGVSVLPGLLGKTQDLSDRPVFWMRREGNVFGGQAYYAARVGDYKILQNTPFEPIQFFNLKDDPYEQRPLDTANSKVYQRLRTELMGHIRASGQVPWQKSE